MPKIAFALFMYKNIEDWSFFTLMQTIQVFTNYF